ncbi:MAG TPA: hypothetical protein VGB37_05255 [Candidatus Lokiarchaeia archaeon]
MVFGKKKEKRFAQVMKPEEVEQPEEVEEEETPRPFYKQQVEKPKEKNKATIVSEEIIDGMRIRTVVISNESFGEIGETFEW